MHRLYGKPYTDERIYVYVNALKVSNGCFLEETKAVFIMCCMRMSANIHKEIYHNKRSVTNPNM